MPRRKKPFRLWFRKEYGLYYVSFPDNPGKWIATGTQDKTEAIGFALECKPELRIEKITF